MERQAENHLTRQDQCDEHAITFCSGVSYGAPPLTGLSQAALR
jgi:hypothetical protein